MCSAIGDENILDIRQIGIFFATHEAERAMARVALAAASSRNERGFPTSLNEISGLFLGNVPTSPYNGASLEYVSDNGGKDFTVAVPELTVGDVTFPRVEFSTVR